MKEVLREILRANNVEDKFVDFLFEGKELVEPNHLEINHELRDADYREFIEKINVFEQFGLGESVAFAVDGKHTETGKPVLITSIEDKNIYPSRYHLVNMNLTLNGVKIHLKGAVFAG